MHELPLPDIYVGAWRRQSLALDGQQPFEDSDVIWLQTRRHFADLRTPVGEHDGNGPSSAFSGTIRWHPPRITFLRDLDLCLVPVDDGATLETIDDDRLIERGSYRHEGRNIPYEEIWRRVAEARGPMRVLEGRLPEESRVSMRLVEVGGIALALLDERAHGGDFTAVQFVRDGHEWRPKKRIGPAIVTPPPDFMSVVASGRLTSQAADPCWARRTWIVQEDE